MIWYILLILLIGALIVWYEVPKMVNQKLWGELVAFSVFLVIGLALAIAQTLHLRVPNPTQAIEAVFGPISRLFYR